MDGLDDTANGTTLHGNGNNLRGLDAHDLAAVADPVVGSVPEDNAEANERHDVGDTGVGSGGNGTLDWWEYSTTGDTHDQDAGTTACVAAKIGGTEGEDGGVHWCLEKEDADQDGNGVLAVTGAEVGVDDDGADGVDCKQEVGLKDGRQACGNETADGEDDQTVRQVVGGLGRGQRCILGGVVDEEGRDGNLSTDVAELGDETEDHVVLLVQRTAADNVAILVNTELQGSLGHDRTRALGTLGHLRQFGEEEHDANGGTGAGDGEVDILHVGEVVGVGAGEEGMGGNEWSNEGSDTVPSLAELQTSGGGLGSTNDDSVRVGGSLESSKAAGDDESAGTEATEGCLAVGRVGKVRSRPKHDGAERVERETHKDGELVALPLQNLSSDRGVKKVTTAKVHDLETGRFELCDAKDSLEVLVEDIEKTVRETPQEKEGDDERDRVDELLAG